MSLRQQLALLRPVMPRARFPSLAWAWPTGERDLLLQAAILGDLRAAAAAYQKWQVAYDFDDVEFSKMRLLAGISVRLPAELLAARDRARLVGVERLLWTHCRVALRAAEPAFASLAAAGIETMVLKGAAQAALDMGNLRGRYASEVDLLVRPQVYDTALATLRAAGWRSTGSSSRAASDVTGTNLRLGAAGEVDLHRVPCHQVCAADLAPDDLWARATRHQFLGQFVLLPSATDRLAIALAHGGIDGHRHSDWLVDAALLVRGGEVDWPLFEALCRERRIEEAAAISLAYLADLQVPVPAEVLRRLVTRGQRHPFRFAAALLEARPKREHSIVSAAGRGLARGWRLTDEARRVGRLRRFADARAASTVTSSAEPPTS